MYISNPGLMVSQKNKLISIFKSAEGVTRVYENGFAETFINEGTFIDVPFLVQGKRHLEASGRGKKIYILSEATGPFRVSKEALELSASKAYCSHLAAVAIINPHLTMRLVVDVYNRINKPHVPTKAFANRKLAKEWLVEMMKMDH